MSQASVPTPSSPQPAAELVVITGLAGSGKSLALHALEDAGYYCVDNLPPPLLGAFLDLQRGQHTPQRLAVAIDARSPQGLAELPAQLHELRQRGQRVHSVFLEADSATLVRRFSETRRRHPLSGQSFAPSDANPAQGLHALIERERHLLAGLRDISAVIDTSRLRGAQLQSWLKQLIEAPAQQMTLMLQSFGFKHGASSDADFVFDVRVLPNPYYDLALRPLTGLDAPVAEFLAAQTATTQMVDAIAQFLTPWLGPLNASHRSYLTVGIGCTGGQHRSVYVVEALARRLAVHWPVLRRHRELDVRTMAAL